VPGFNPKAFEEVTVLPSERVRHHLLRFDDALGHALGSGLRCDRLTAENLVTQAQLLGFAPLAEALSAAFFDGSGNPDGALRSAELAIAEARPKIAELLNTDFAP